MRNGIVIKKSLFFARLYRTYTIDTIETCIAYHIFYYVIQRL